MFWEIMNEKTIEYLFFYFNTPENEHVEALITKNKKKLTESTRFILEKYLNNDDFKINNLWNYYFYNQFLQTDSIEHQCFYKQFHLPQNLKNNYVQNVIKPLKRLFHQKNNIVKELKQPEIAYLKEKKELYKAFIHDDVDVLLKKIEEYFYKVGYGILSKFYYFEWQNKLIGISNYLIKNLEQLVGYESQKQMVLKNTEDFLNGKNANNVFLYGSRGTGKTSLIKSLLEKYKYSGLRLIKLFREDIQFLPKISEILKKRKEKFIINLDDISYDENEVIYKKHKVAIDSFFDREPKNVLLYATSNSQEIVKYDRKNTTDNMVLDNRGEEEKKLELPEKQKYDERRAFTERFGLTVFFGRTDKNVAKEILEFYLKKYELNISLQDLEKEYHQWVAYHGSPNGRTIENFIKFFYNR